MKLFYDEVKPVLRECVPFDELPIDELEFANAPIIRIQNVADYFWPHERLRWDAYTDFPNLAPPFPAFWMEYRLPSTLRTEEGLVALADDARDRVGLYFTTKYEEGVFDGEMPRWFVRAVLFIGAGGTGDSIAPVFVWWYLRLTEDGRVAEDGSEVSIKTGYDGSRLPDADQAIQLMMYLHPALMAISFLHCKNVEIMIQGGPRVTHGKRVRHRKPPTTQHYTLHIEPMKQVLKTEGNSETSGLKHALHICRGHFKDYSKGAGLFGKYQGLYWWESHVRGSEAEGKIEKSYAVHPPKQENEDE